MNTNKENSPQVENPEGGKFVEEDGQGTLFEKPPQEEISKAIEKRDLLRKTAWQFVLISGSTTWLISYLKDLKKRKPQDWTEEGERELERALLIQKEDIKSLEWGIQLWKDQKLEDLADNAPLEKTLELLKGVSWEDLKKYHEQTRIIAEKLSLLIKFVEDISPDLEDPQAEEKQTAQRFVDEFYRATKNPATTGATYISKDAVYSEFSSMGDLMEIGSEKDKQIIADLQKKGKLLFGSMEGLSGGTAFFKSVSIALAKILNKQSNYYNQTDGQRDRLGGRLLSGVPMGKIREMFGESAKLEELEKLETPKKTPKVNGEDRHYPYIILSYEELAKELSKTGKISGGKDIEFIRLYINGGYREYETDPKTGNRIPVKSSYVPGIASKKYPISNGKGGFIFVPFVVNEFEIVDTSRKDPEVGCLLRLSPQYAKTLRGYTALRGDTIQLIGGGRQKDITMDIIFFLVFSRNVTPVLRKSKASILSKYEDRPTYRDPKTGKRRVSKLEAHFKEAIQKSIEAKILQEYREERSPGGEIISVFVYNPDYLKGEEIETPEEQTGENI